MRSFPSSDLKQATGDVLDAASHGPVAITKHRKRRFVLMSIQEYEARFPKDERRAIATVNMPAEHLKTLEAAFKALPPRDRE